MKALSLTQPWASLVIEGFKKYETRSWSTTYRGALAIHASKGFPGWAKSLLIDDNHEDDNFIRDALNRNPGSLPLGAILGIVTLVDCQPTYDVLGSDTVFISQPEHDFGDWSEGRYAWKLDGPLWFIDPVPVKGALSLWEIPPTEINQVNAEINRLTEDVAS